MILKVSQVKPKEDLFIIKLAGWFSASFLFAYRNVNFVNMLICAKQYAIINTMALLF